MRESHKSPKIRLLWTFWVIFGIILSLAGIRTATKQGRLESVRMGKMLKTFGIYFMGNVFSRLISFAMLALLTRYIEPEGMGYFETANGKIGRAHV